MNELKDIPVVLNNITQEDTYTGNFTERQALIWTLDFTLKGYLYGPVTTTPIIKFVYANYYTPDVPDGDLPSAVGVTTKISQTIDQPGLLANGQPTTNAAASVPVSQIQVTDDYGFVIIKNDFTNDG
jgi:hypothetical protein